MAQATKITADDIHFDEADGLCVYPAKPAYALGISALPLLVAAMVVSTVAGGCFGCVKPRDGAAGSRRLKGILCCVASWIVAAVAVAEYVQGVKWNAATTRDAITMTMGWHDRCYYLKGAVFTTPALLTLIAAAFGVRSFTMLLTLAAGGAAAAAEAEPKHDGQQPPVAGAGDVVGEARQSQTPQSAPPQGKAPEQVV